MYNVMYCEFLKLKKSYFYLLLLIGICFFPALMCLGWLGQGAYVYWNRYIFQVEQMTYLFSGTILYVLIAAYIYSREFSCGAANTLFSYPVSRAKIFMAKFIIIVLFIFGAIILQLLLTILGGLLLPHEPLTMAIMEEHLKINLLVLLLQCSLLPVAILITLLSRNIIMPIIYGAFVTIVNVCIMGLNLDSVAKYIPTLYPITTLFHSFTTDSQGKMEFVHFTLSNYSISIAAITFIVSMALCIIYYLKTDID
ncbi:ABC transporter permease [Neobacillus niacini]|uniref:ABC transporter permease n=1 Tax=Neobacillus niacini TaxID=86668 RepID=UPI0021CB54C1|nr:ABC transporter permease [Neobacillus niacini]MCM3767265.1 ABC transporter permease [Neobacillus niacini]